MMVFGTFLYNAVFSIIVQLSKNSAVYCFTAISVMTSSLQEISQYSQKFQIDLFYPSSQVLRKVQQLFKLKGFTDRLRELVFLSCYHLWCKLILCCTDFDYFCCRRCLLKFVLLIYLSR
jgi:hypothetical protein